MKLFGKWFGFTPEEIFEEAMACFERGDYDDAIEAFEACQNELVDETKMEACRTVASECRVRIAQKHLGSDGSIPESRRFSRPVTRREWERDPNTGSHNGL